MIVGNCQANLRFVCRVVLCLLLPAAIGCGQGSSGTGSVTKECSLPQDQAGTLSGRWQANPIPIAFRVGHFSTDEMAQIVKAAKVWNDFFKASLDIAIFDYGDEANPRQSNAEKPSALCATGIVQGPKFTGQVVIYKQPKWPYGNHAAIAITSFCPIPSKPIPNIFMAIMEANYEDFFSKGKKLPDLSSIFVHEFGHLLGLDHSCDTKGKSGFPSCTDKSLPQDYFSAVMFPVVIFDQAGTGEARRVLQSNDQGRANCLYQDRVVQKNAGS